MRWIPFIILAACGGDDTKGDGVTRGGITDDTGTSDVLLVDEDRDGVLAEDDCDDNDWSVYPGADEICDAKDNDCDGEVDEGFDLDEDGEFDQAQCDHGNDCDEADPEIPTSEIPYDGIDQDCDGSDMADVDRDGFDGRTGGGNDCDDFDDSVYPGAPEVPRDGVDQDCNGVDLTDGDGDGYEAVSEGGEDCDDDDAAINPDALDWYGDGEDTDCDGSDGGLFSAANAPVVITGTPGEYELAGHDIVVCDLDSDGLRDVIITAPYTGDFNGAVGVFYGRNVDDWGHMTLDEAGTYLLAEGTGWGFGAACADVDGDGRDDLIVGQGELQFGPFVSDFTINIIYGVGGMLPGLIDDLDADAQLSVDLGAPGGVGEVQTGLVTATDLSGDGMAEIIIDQEVGNTSAGASAIWVILGDEYLGASDLGASTMATLADVQGDTVETLVAHEGMYAAGQPRYRPGLPEEGGDPSLYPVGGKVAVMGLVAGSYDSISDAAQVEFSLDGSGGLGSAIAMGDYDGDGETDIALGGVDAGCVFMVSNLDAVIASGGASTLSMAAVDAAAEADKSICGSPRALGGGVSIGGDVDGDGEAELLVQETNTDGVGAVWLISGALLAASDGPAPPSELALMGVRAQYPSERLGSTMAMADLDGDGRDDLIIGASHHPSPASVGLAMSGRVSIFLSSRY